MIEPVWLTVPDVLYLHERSIELFGGSYGTRDEGLLESAVMRPQQLRSYTEPPPSLADLAASIGFGLARNHPFIDGNKRTAYAAVLSFLYENGAYLDVSELEAERVMVNVASGLMPEALFASWISANILATED